MTLKVGSDIEYLISSEQGPNPLSLIPGSAVCPFDKEEPAEYEYGKMHWDNIAIEICPNPAESEDEFVTNIQGMKSTLLSEMMSIGAKLTPLASAYVSQDLVNSDTGSEFGCSPDLNAYTRTLQRPSAIKAGNLRTAGGHVHISGPETPTNSDKMVLTKLCDLYLGVPSVLLDQDIARRRLYGKAGSMRIKDYGIEYRVLSNFWTFHENLMRWVYNQVEEVNEFYTQMRKLEPDVPDAWRWLTSAEVANEVRNIIDTGDKRKARSYIKWSNIAMP